MGSAWLFVRDGHKASSLSFIRRVLFKPFHKQPLVGVKCKKTHLYFDALKAATQKLQKTLMNVISLQVPQNISYHQTSVLYPVGTLYLQKYSEYNFFFFSSKMPDCFSLVSHGLVFLHLSTSRNLLLVPDSCNKIIIECYQNVKKLLCHV